MKNVRLTINEVKMLRFLSASDLPDLVIAALVAVVVGGLLSLWAYPAIHPDAWGAAAIAAGARPPETPVAGLWTFIARGICHFLGQEGGFAALGVAGRVAGGVFAGLVYLLLRGILAPRLALQPQELVPVMFRLRLFAAAGALVFAFSDSVWRLTQFFSNDLFHLLLAALALCCFGVFRRGGGLSWYCLTYVFSGVLAAETPVGTIFACGFFVINEVMKYRARQATRAVRAYGFEDEEPLDEEGGEPAAEAMGVSTGVDKGAKDDFDKVAAVFDDEVEEEVDRATTGLENWAFGVFFFTGFVTTLFVDAWAFRALGGMGVKSLGAWDYPVALVSAWTGQFRAVITTDDFLAATALSLVPFVIAYVLMPLATASKSRLAFPLGWLMLFLGLAAYTQLGPVSKLWYWAWDYGRASTPSGVVQTVLAFFGAGTVVIALQTACCGCRKRVKGVDTLALEESRAHVLMRVFGFGVLVCCTLAVLGASTAGRRQALVRTRLGLLWDYVKLTANHVKDTRWVFTDGSFDDALGLELCARGQRQTGLVSVMSGHTPYETFLRVRTAQDAEDKPILEAGGGEALRFWVNEKNEHLRASAVQVGFEALKRCRDVHPRPAGLAMRVPSSPDAARAFDAADGEAVAFSALALQVAARPGGALAGFDRSVAEKFDFMLWRLARMADQRALAFARRDNVQSMAEQRDLSHALDQANLSARILDGKLERLKPTEGVVLTPREGLWVSLKRADFDLARRYAVMVLRTQPQDVDANFALGMWALETREYMRAVRYLQAVLRQKPNEPTVLNNLALAYLKLNFFTEALEHAERAVALFPSSEELRRNLDRIRKARDEGAAEGCAEAASKKDEPKNEDEAKSVLHEVVKPVKIKDAPPAPKKDAKKDAKKPVPAKPVAAPERG